MNGYGRKNCWRFIGLWGRWNLAHQRVTQISWRSFCDSWNSWQAFSRKSTSCGCQWTKTAKKQTTCLSLARPAGRPSHLRGRLIRGCPRKSWTYWWKAQLHLWKWISRVLGSKPNWTRRWRRRLGRSWSSRDRRVLSPSYDSLTARASRRLGPQTSLWCSAQLRLSTRKVTVRRCASTHSKPTKLISIWWLDTEHTPSASRHLLGS